MLDVGVGCRAMVTVAVTVTDKGTLWARVRVRVGLGSTLPNTFQSASLSLRITVIIKL